MPLTYADLRRLALALPATTEAPHFDYGSFRVGGKIYATVPPERTHTHLFLDPPEVEAAVGQPGVELRHWGKTAYLRVELAEVEPASFEALLRAAWARRAPRRLGGRGGR